MWCWRRMEKISWTGLVGNEDAVFCFLGNLPASELLVPDVSELSIRSIFICVELRLWRCNGYKVPKRRLLKAQTHGGYPKRNTIRHSTHGESLKSRNEDVLRLTSFSVAAVGCAPSVTSHRVRNINHVALATEARGARPDRAIDVCLDHANSLYPMKHLSPWIHIE